MSDAAIMQRSAGERLALIASSFARVTGRPLLAPGEQMWSAPRAVVAHGTQDPPLFFYGNAQALRLFGMDADQFIGLPSYQSAEPALREERAAMLDQLEARNVIDNYRGVRIAADGTRFMIENAVVWNLLDDDGRRHGQAASFAEWRLL